MRRSSGRRNRSGAPVLHRVMAAAACAVLLVMASVVLVGGDDTSDSPTRPGPRSSASTSEAHAAVAALDMAALGRDAPGTLAVAVHDRLTGATALNAAGDTALHAASLAKLLVAVDILHRSRGKDLPPRTESLIRRSLRVSDNAAMNALWANSAGPGAITRVTQRLGLQDTHPPREHGRWGETVISARDMVTLLDHVVTTMPAPAQALIVTSLRSAPRTAADGFDQSFGVDATRTPAPVAAKKGWMCCPSGQLSLHSAALVGKSLRFIVVVLYEQPVEYGFTTARRVVNHTADTLLDTLH